MFELQAQCEEIVPRPQRVGIDLADFPRPWQVTWVQTKDAMRAAAVITLRHDRLGAFELHMIHAVVARLRLEYGQDAISMVVA